MKVNEKKDLQVKTKNELVKLLQEAQALLMTLKLDHQQAKLKDTRSIFNTRKRIAVLQTILKGKPVEEVKEETKEKEVKKGK